VKTRVDGEPLSVGRRKAIQFGAVAVASTLVAGRSVAQKAEPSVGDRTTEVIAETGPGYTNNSARAFGNGPMDETTRKLVTYVSSFSESDLTPKIVSACSNTMLDSIGAILSGFECEPARICARMAMTIQSTLKSTVFGYGIVTSPELAAYANTSMGRHTDFNDHASDMTPGILAIGEALHLSGTKVMMSIILAYQINDALASAAALGDSSGWDQGITVGPATALAVGKLLGLNEDQLANALSLALVPHIPMRVARTGTLSMAKGCATAPAVRDAVFSALLAKEGMTGAAQPFEARDGLWDRVTGPFKELRLPPRSEPGVGLTGGIKRYPSESQSHALLEIIPQIRSWTSADDIESIRIEVFPHTMMEIGDPPKWDPKNSETADHSMAYLVAVALIDGEVYLSSYTPKRIADTATRQLMNKITMQMNPEFVRNHQRITVRKKTGEEMTKEVTSVKPMTREEISAKFDRVCSFIGLPNAQRDRIRASWSNLQVVPDIADPIRDLAHYGNPRPL